MGERPPRCSDRCIGVSGRADCDSQFGYFAGGRIHCRAGFTILGVAPRATDPQLARMDGADALPQRLRNGTARHRHPRPPHRRTLRTRPPPGPRPRTPPHRRLQAPDPPYPERRLWASQPSACLHQDRWRSPYPCRSGTGLRPEPAGGGCLMTSVVVVVTVGCIGEEQAHGGLLHSRRRRERLAHIRPGWPPPRPQVRHRCSRGRDGTPTTTAGDHADLGHRRMARLCGDRVRPVGVQPDDHEAGERRREASGPCRRPGSPIARSRRATGRRHG